MKHTHGARLLWESLHTNWITRTLCVPMILSVLIGLGVIAAAPSMADTAHKTTTHSASQAEAPHAKTSSDDTSDNGGFEFHVISHAVGKPHVISTSLTNTHLSTVGGATQLLWQSSDFKSGISAASVKDAFKSRIKVNAPGSNTSSVIYQKSHHRKQVVLTAGSVVRDTGLHNQLRVGKVLRLKVPVVVSYNPASHQYREAAHLLTKAQLKSLNKTAKGGKYVSVGSFIGPNGVRYYIVVWCGNYMGGDVQLIRGAVVWVRYASSLFYTSQATSVASSVVTYQFQVTCPNNGASFQTSGSAQAMGVATNSITYNASTKAKAIGGMGIKAKNNIKVDSSTESSAQTSVTVSGQCGSTPPSQPKAPIVTVDGNTCPSDGSQPTTAVGYLENPNDTAMPGSLGLSDGQGHSFDSIASGGTVTHVFTGLKPGSSYTLTGRLNNDDTLIDKVTFTVPNCVKIVQPSVSATVQGCLSDNTARPQVIVSYTDGNAGDTSIDVTFNGSTYAGRPLDANGSGSTTFGSPSVAGSYSGSVKGNPSGASASFTVSVQNCPVPPPSIDEIEQPNDVLVNNGRTITVSGTVPDGRSARLFSTACNGGTITNNKSVTVTGSFSIEVGYMAPGEVPAAQTKAGCETATGKDRVNVTLTDLADATLNDSDYVTFDIRPAPVDPNKAHALNVQRELLAV